MNPFEQVKANVKPRAVMEQAGLTFNRNQMCCCPFHPDKTPSMKVKPNDEKYYCFGCGAKGDAVDFVASFYNMNALDAALKIADDFGISVETSHRKAEVKRKKKLQDLKSKMTERDLLEQELDETVRFLSLYLAALLEWKRVYAPKTPEEEWHPLFVEALQYIDQTEYLIDLVENSIEEDTRSIGTFMQKEVSRIVQRLQRLDAETAAPGKREIKKPGTTGGTELSNLV